jgi:hypothetical protein
LNFDVISSPFASLLYSRGELIDIFGFSQIFKVNPPLQHLKSYKNDVTGHDVTPVPSEKLAALALTNSEDAKHLGRELVMA